MRATTLLRRMIGITGLFVEDVVFTVCGAVSAGIRPTWRLPRCGTCEGVAPGYDRRSVRRWQHHSYGGRRIELTYAPRRVACPSCGIRTEMVPWAETGSRFTLAFEEYVAYLAQISDKTKVTRLTGVSWVTVGSIVERVVERRRDPGCLDNVRRIGIDEFSFRKHHRYLTVVVDHDRRRIIWAAEGRSAETLRGFFEELGDERRRLIETVTIDMAGSYKKAAREWLPHATVIFDRFHVQRLASNAVDEVRRQIVRSLRGTDEAKAVKNTRYALLKNRWNLTPSDSAKIAGIQQTNKPLYRSYLLKESLVKALDYRQPWRARRALQRWLAWASRSRLKPFVRVARTIRKHLEGILAYINERLTNGLVEGMNNKLRMISRRAFGFHSAQALAAMAFLVCGGIQLSPDLPT